MEWIKFSKLVKFVQVMVCNNQKWVKPTEMEMTTLFRWVNLTPVYNAESFF